MDHIGGCAPVRVNQTSIDAHHRAIIAIAVAGWALCRHGKWTRLIRLAPLAVLAVSWLLPVNHHKAIQNAAQFVLIPALTAAVAIKINMYQHITLWALIVFVLLSGDGRWLGAYIGTMTLGGRRSLRSMRLVLGSMACGPTQLAVTAIALHVWLIPETLGLALLAGAILIEITTPMRRRMAAELTEAEAEIEELEDQL